MRFPPLRMVLLLLLLAPIARAAAAEPDFAAQVAPILMEKCLACHNSKKAEGGYRVDTFSQLQKEGDSGALPLNAATPEQSELLRRITSDDEFERMPLDADRLPAEQIELIRRWIASGAAAPEPLRQQPLAAIVPAAEHPAAPAIYPAALPITALAFTADGRRLLVSGYHELTVWSVPEGKLVQRIGNLPQRIYSISFHADGQRVAIAGGQPGRSGELRILDLESGEMLHSWARTDDAQLAAAFHPSGELLAVAGTDATAKIYRLSDGQLLHNLTSHADWITALTWSPDGKLLATASRDKTAKVFRVADGDSLITFTGHEAAVSGVAFHPDGKRLYTAGADRQLRRWKLTGSSQEKATGLQGTPNGLAATESWLFVPTSNKGVLAADMNSGEAQRTFSGHTDWVLSVAVHAKTGRVAAGAIDGRVVVWNAESTEKQAEFIAQP